MPSPVLLRVAVLPLAAEKRCRYQARLSHISATRLQGAFRRDRFD
jgi:hypothetical protein